MTRPPRIAIASPGVGLVQRGFERLFRDLFELMRDDVDITLLKGGGPNLAQEKRMRFLPRGGRFLKWVPLHHLIKRTPMHIECLTFALAMMPSLLAGRYDIVHVIDPPLARLLYHFRRLTGARFRLLYTEGTAMPPGDYPPAAHIPQISEATYQEAVEHGHLAEKMTVLPCGYAPARFAKTADRNALRREYDVPQDTFVVLSVAALNRYHKRTHHLINEFANGPEKALLWLDGSLDHGDADLPNIARDRLGENVRITHVESDKVKDLFGLADIFVHTAGFEAFGIAIIEAAGYGIPILIHDAPHFQWLIPEDACRINMLEDGMLAEKLHQLVADKNGLSAMTVEEFAKNTYAWPVLRDSYASLYRRMMDM